MLEEKKAKREEKKKEKALLDKVLGEGSPQASPKKKPPPVRHSMELIDSCGMFANSLVEICREGEGQVCG